MEISKNSNLRPACCSFTFDKVRNKLRVVIKSCSVAATQRSFCAGYIHKYFGVIMKLSLQLYWDPNYSFHIILQNNPKSFGALTRKEMPNGYLRDRVITLPQSLDLSLHILFFPYDWLERLWDSKTETIGKIGRSSGDRIEIGPRRLLSIQLGHQLEEARIFET